MAALMTHLSSINLYSHRLLELQLREMKVPSNPIELIRMHPGLDLTQSIGLIGLSGRDVDRKTKISPRAKKSLEKVMALLDSTIRII